MKNPKEAHVKEFIRESNAIERVYDDDSFEQAMNAWDYLYNHSELDHSVILKTHKILMLNQRGLYPNEKGYYRTIPVFIGNKSALDAKDIRDEMEVWIDYMNDPERCNPEFPIDMLEQMSKVMHVNYEHIHPFVDGNGRTGRMFMNWWRVKKAGLPLLIIHEDQEQLDYYEWFKN